MKDLKQLTSEDIRKESDILRDNAVRNLNNLFRIPEGFESDLTRKIVSDIINATILRISSIQKEIVEDQHGN